MNLAEWARAQGISPCAAYRWFRHGTLPVPVQRVGPRTIWMNVDVGAAPDAMVGIGLYARVSSHDHKPDLECQVAGLSQWAAKRGRRIARLECEIALGVNGSGSKARRLPADPDVTTIVVEHEGRLGGVNVELAEAALVANGRRLVAGDDGEVVGDLVRDMGQAPACLCARRYGRRSARDRARTAVDAARHG
ncbi:IS607 family transposase [Actinoallomurus vinaceus]|uniref:IS607 family transposase n=1 Tax=Actinoallomurus vinaceus TaxID=1080074 RepID=UPI0031EBAD79